MRRIFLVAGLAPILLAATLPQVRQDDMSGDKIWWSPELTLQSLADIDSQMLKPFRIENKQSTLVLERDDQQITVHTCAEYLAAIDRKMYPENELANDWPFITRCYALRYLRSAQAPTKSFLGAGWEGDVIHHVPPFRFFAEPALVGKADAARERGESWAAFDQTIRLVSRTPLNVTLQNDWERWNIEIVAQADLNHDGVQDQVVIICNSKLSSGGGFCFPAVFTRYASDSMRVLLSDVAPPYALKSNDHDKH